MPEKPNIEIVIFGSEKHEEAGEVEGLDRLYVDWDKREAWFIAGWKVSDLRDNKGVKVSYVGGYYGDWAAKNKLRVIPEDIAGKL